MKSLAFVVIALIATISAVGISSDRAIGKKAKDFTLLDQFENEWTWSKHCKGRPTIMVLSHWKGSDFTAAWTDPLVGRFKDRVQFVALADVSLAPGFLEGYLRSRFRDAYKTPILLDFEGEVFEYYQFVSGIPNVLFIDANGVVRLHTWGKGAPDRVSDFSDNVAKLLQ